VLDASAEYVVVEVVSAPGLEPGARLRFTQAAVAEMSLVDESEWRRGAAEHGRKRRPTLRALRSRNRPRTQSHSVAFSGDNPAARARGSPPTTQRRRSSEQSAGTSPAAVVILF